MNEIDIDLFESMGGSIGFDEDSLTEIVYRQGDSIMNEGLPLFTGSQTPRPKGGWADATTLFYRNADPLPSTVLSMTISK